MRRLPSERVRAWLRGWWPDRNPLRRGADRAQAAIVTGLLGAFLAGAPLAAIGAARWAGGAAEHAQRTARYPVAAVVLARVPLPSQSPYGAWPAARATWTAPDGASRTGLVPAPPSASAGTTVTVWTDSSGRLVTPPVPRSAVDDDATAAAALAVAALGLALLTAGLLARAVLDRWRLAAWDAEWRAAGPQWFSHR